MTFSAALALALLATTPNHRGLSTVDNVLANGRWQVRRSVLVGRPERRGAKLLHRAAVMQLMAGPSPKSSASTPFEVRARRNCCESAAAAAAAEVCCWRIDSGGTVVIVVRWP